MKTYSFEEIYRKVPSDQKEQFRTFRAQHPVKHLQASNALWEYIACGQGQQSLLLLAGGARFGDAWFQLIMALESEYRIIAPTDPGLPTMSALIDGIAAILEKESIAHTNVIGTSFGGLLAQCFVRTYPEHVDKLILSNTLVPSAIPAKLTAFALKISGLYPTRILQLSAKWNMLYIMSLSKSNREFWKAFWTEKTQSHLLHMKREETISQYKVGLDLAKNYCFTVDDLSDWPGQVYLIESDDDIAYIRRAGADLKALYPDAQVYTFHKAGHTPGYSNPKEYCAVLKGFLGEEA